MQRMWQRLPYGIWKGCDLPFSYLWPGLLLLVVQESLFWLGLGRRGGELPTSCWLSLPDPTHTEVFLFAVG